MTNFFKWIKNLWNLNKKLDSLTSDTDCSLSKVAYLITQWEYLRGQLLDLTKQVKKLQEKQKTIPIEVIEDTQPKNIKVNKYYDPQMNVEYVDIEINGEKASPNDDTVVDK